MVTTGVDSPPGAGPGSPDEPPPGSDGPSPAGPEGAGPIGPSDPIDPADPVDTHPGRGSASPRRRSRLWLAARIVLVAALVAFLVSGFFAFRPVTNPGVQQCGSPILFALRNEPDIRVPAPGSRDEPANADELRAQPRCRLLVDDQLWTSLFALGVGIVLAGLGAVIGLLDDRLAYRRSPRFESFLRERPPGVPSDPWNQPVVPLDDLGRRLPELEWTEIRWVIAAGARRAPAAAVAVPVVGRVGRARADRAGLDRDRAAAGGRHLSDGHPRPARCRCLPEVAGHLGGVLVHRSPAAGLRPAGAGRPPPRQGR